MYYRRLGGTGLLAGEIGLSATALGDSTLSDSDATNLVQFALAAGASLIDTADLDGAGLAEQRIGRAVAARREQALIATKGGRGPNAEPFAAARIEEAARASHARLACGPIDIYQLHHPEPADLDDEALWQTLERLRAEGIIKHLGVVAATPEAASAALASGRITVLQLPYNALAAAMQPLLAQARKAGVAVLAGSPLLGGVLSADTSPAAISATAEAVIARVRSLTRDSGRTAAQTALGWVLAHEEIAVVLPSPRTTAQLEEAIAASDLPLPSERLLAAIQNAWHTVPAG
jgi:aryl-alcohol dehydrogenase-like predicted oxidoreductase